MGPATRFVAINLALFLMTGIGWCAEQLAATPPGVPSMELSEALDYASAHQPQIRSALAELAARQSEARVPRAAWFPQVGASAQLLVGSTNNTTASYLNVPETDLPRIGSTRAVGSTNWSPSPSSLLALTIDQQVYDFGRIAAQASVADAQADIARANAETIGLEIQLAVEESFHAVLAAKEVMAATEDAYRRSLAHRDYAKAGTKSGLRPPIELTRAQADVALLEVRRVRARTGLQAARASLAAGIGAGTLEVDAKAPPAGETGTIAFDEALRLAAARNPVITAALSRVKAQQSVTRAIARELAPNLFASATLSGRAGGAAPSTGEVPFGEGWLPDVGNWHVGLVFQWNLFDMTVLARRSAAKAREGAALADLELARTSVTLAAQRAYLELDAAQQALPGLASALAAAQANQAQADARFRAGLGTTIELADAESLLTNAQLELAIGRFTVARSRAALGRVIAEKRVMPPLPKGKANE